MIWFIAALVATCLVAFLAIQFTVPFLAVTAGLIALSWLLRQGFWRASYALVIFFTLGAISSIGPWSSVSTYGRVAAVALLLFATFATTSKGDAKPLGGLQKWIFAFLGLLTVMAGVSAIWSASVSDTLIQFALLAALLLVMNRLVRRRWVDRGTMVGDLRAGIIVLSVSMAAGIVTFYAGFLPPTFSGRFQGLFNNPNAAALVAVVTLFIGWGVFLEKRSVVNLLLLASPLLTIALTETRTAFLAVVVGGLWIALRGGLRIFLTTLAVGVAVAILGVPLWQPVLARFGVVAAGDVYAGRTLGWATALELLQERPIGYGWGSTQTVFASAYQSGASLFQPQSIHNSYLQVAFEISWVGFGVMVLALAGVVVMILRQKPVGVEIGLSGAVVAGLIIHFSESAIFGTGQPYPWVYWFAVAGLMASMTRHQPEWPVRSSRKALARTS